MTEAAQAVETPQAEVAANPAPETVVSTPAPEAQPSPEAQETPAEPQVRKSLLNQPKAEPAPEVEPEAEAVATEDPAPETEAAEPEAQAEEPEVAAPEEEAPEAEADEEAEPEAEEEPKVLEWADIRDLMAGDNEMLQKMLGRYRSAQALANAFAQQRKEISRLKNEVGQPPELPDNPTEEDVAEYRKALNIPNDVEDYQVDFGESFQASEADTPLLDSYKGWMHENNVPPQFAQKNIEWYEGFVEDQRQAMNQQAEETQTATVAALSNEWGKEYDGNLNAVRAYLDATIGAEEAGKLRDARMADGTYLADNANFLRLMAGPAVDALGGVAMYAGDSAAGIKSYQNEKKQIMSLRLTDEAEYMKPETQMRLQEVNAKLSKLGKL